MKKIEKYEKGYFGFRKKKLILNMFFNLLAALAVFIFGLLVNKFELRNIFSVIAMLFILPIARSFAELFILLPYKKADENDYAKAEKAIEGKGMLLYEAVFTSSERPMHLNMIALFHGRILGYEARGISKNEKTHEENLKEAKKYIDKHLENQGLGEKIVIFDDINKFINAFPADRELTEEVSTEITELKKSMEYFVV